MRSKTERMICGTCEYWTGNRNPVFDKNSIPKIDIIDKTGNCENQNCKFTNKERNCDKNYIHYSKWTELF